MYQMMYEMLNVHVSASDDAVKTELRSRLKSDADPARVEALEAHMLIEHRAARELYEDVVGGRIG